MILDSKLIAPTLPVKRDSTDWLGYEAGSVGARDEAFDSAGKVRPQWQDFRAGLEQLGLPELTRRWEEAQHLIHENGVTYNVYGDPRGMERPWQLDPIPSLITSEEWTFLEAGLIQRGRLLEALIQDLYGPQRCLASGWVPPELVYGNPAFLLPCHGLYLPNQRYLHFYAVNIGRSADGGFCALGDRTQSPSGAGYALENRIVLARLLPDLFRDYRVQRLALFFRSLRETIRSLAPRNRDNPRTVLLTPGPYNETYFEHAYLARYLGYTLVEGGDLTVRDNQVFLKVLGGLQPVDVIFRRLDDDFCDPLELRPDSFLGVPGLVQAVRAGNVAVANALGSGLLETPALLEFLPELCRHLLGEELRLPSVATWWCGRPQSLEYVLSHLDTLVVKPALPSGHMEPIFADELSAEQRAAVIQKIRARPGDYVGQARLSLSTGPVLADHRLQPRHQVLRAYLAAHQDSYVVMPGGLTRFSNAADTMVVSMQRGGGSKDTWVLSDSPVSNFSLLRDGSLSLELTRGGSDLPSRMADNLYWLGRYAERADGLTRLLRCILVRLTERPGLAEAPELPALLRSLTTLSDCQPGFLGLGSEARLAAPEAELLSVIHDAGRPGSLASVLNILSRLAGTVRDRISSDMWRVLKELGQFGQEKVPFGHVNGTDGGHKTSRTKRTLSAELDLLDQTILTLAAFGGLAMESVTRGEGWRFLDMGRKLERCLHTSELVSASLVPAGLVPAGTNEGPLLEALLEIADSVMTYRRRYQGSLQAPAVLDLLLADESNPRSLAFQMAALADDVDHLPRESKHPGRSAEQRLSLSLLTGLRLADVQLLAAVESTGKRIALEELLARLVDSLPALSDIITQAYLSHLQTSRHLATLDAGSWAER